MINKLECSTEIFGIVSLPIKNLNKISVYGQKIIKGYLTSFNVTSEILSFGFGLKIGKSSGKMSGLLDPQFPIGSAFSK